MSAALSGWRWDAPVQDRPRYRRGVAHPSSGSEQADAENEGARAAESHNRAVGVAITLTALAAPAIVGMLAWWRTLTHTRRRAADRRINMAVTMDETRHLTRGNIVVAAVLWGLIPLAAQALLIRIPDWTAIRAALQALDWNAVGALAQDGAIGLLAGPAAGLVAVALSTILVRTATKNLRGRAHLRAELAASLDAALDLPAGTSHSHLGWERDGADAVIDLSRVPSIAGRRATKASVESDLTAQRSTWTVDELNYPTLRLRPVEVHDLERRRVSEASGGLLAGAHQDDEPTTLWKPPHAA